MTKKSQARQERDAFIKQVESDEANDWDILDKMKNGLGLFLMAKLQVLTNYNANTELMDLMPEVTKQEFMVRSAALVKDVNIIGNDLAAIASKHAGKTGLSKGFEDTRNLILLQEEYYQLQERIDGVVTANAVYIDAMMGVQLDAVTYNEQFAQPQDA